MISATSFTASYSRQSVRAANTLMSMRAGFTVAWEAISWARSQSACLLHSDEGGDGAGLRGHGLAGAAERSGCKPNYSLCIAASCSTAIVMPFCTSKSQLNNIQEVTFEKYCREGHTIEYYIV